jgi:hypothetical protein
MKMDMDKGIDMESDTEKVKNPYIGTHFNPFFLQYPVYGSV